MVEKIKILAHHVERIKTDYSDFAKRNFRFLVKAGMRKTAETCIAQTDVLMYPGLNEPKNFKMAVRAKIKAAQAVCSDSYESIPDLNPDGSQNFDLICEACVNYLPKEHMCRITQIIDQAMKRVEFFGLRK